MVDDEPLPILPSVGEAIARRQLKRLSSWKHRERIRSGIDRGFAVDANVLLAENDPRFRVRGTRALEVLLNTRRRSDDDWRHGSPENRLAVVERRCLEGVAAIEGRRPILRSLAHLALCRFARRHALTTRQADRHER